MVAAIRLGEQPARYERWPGAAARLLAAYERRTPEATALHRLVRTHLSSLLAEARERDAWGHGLPRFVEQEFERYLACGILAHGFASASARGSAGPWEWPSREA